MTPSRIAAAVVVLVVLAAAAVAVVVTRADGDDAARGGEATPLAGAPGRGGVSGASGGAGVSGVAAPEPMSMPIVASEARPGPDVAEAPAERGITVTGSGIVETTPDQSEWSFGVQEQGETAQQALERASERAERLVAALRREGIAERDLRTEQVSVWPNHDGRGVSGYVASTSVHTLVRDLDRASGVVDAAVAAGANQVSGPGLAASDRERLYRQALAAAVDQARANAQALAQHVGAQLGPVVAIRESGSMPPPVVAEAAMAAEDSRASMPIQPGKQQISATVTVTFALGGGETAP